MKKLFANRQSVAAQIFRPLYSLLDDIDKEVVDEVDGAIAIQVLDTQTTTSWASASLYLYVWCTAFQRIADLSRLSIKVDSLMKLAEELQQPEVVVEEHTIKEARSELDALRALWCKLPYNVIQKGLRKLRSDVLDTITTDTMRCDEN